MTAPHLSDYDRLSIWNLSNRRRIIGVFVMAIIIILCVLHLYLPTAHSKALQSISCLATAPAADE